MRYDCHAHLFDLAAGGAAPAIPADRVVVHSMHSRAEWDWHRAAYGDSPRVRASFGIHPQRPVMDEADFLRGLAEGGKIAAVGECGFDAFGEFRPTMAEQERAFDLQVELALGCRLPLVVHLRKAFDAFSSRRKKLAGLPALVLHSWSFSPEEADKLLSAGVPALFSFGTTLLFKMPAGPNRALRSLAALGADRVLLETDAPYQPTRDRERTELPDLDRVYEAAAQVRGCAVAELEAAVGGNFRRTFDALR